VTTTAGSEIEDGDTPESKSDVTTPTQSRRYRRSTDP